MTENPSPADRPVDVTFFRTILGALIAATCIALGGTSLAMHAALQPQSEPTYLALSEPE